MVGSIAVFAGAGCLSLERNEAYVVVGQADKIMLLARKEWPALTGLALGSQPVQFGGIWWWYKTGVYLFTVEERDRAKERHGGTTI